MTPETLVTQDVPLRHSAELAAMVGWGDLLSAQASPVPNAEVISGLHRITIKGAPPFHHPYLVLPGMAPSEGLDKELGRSARRYALRRATGKRIRQR